MTLDEAIEIAVARTGWGRYRVLCDESHPSHVAYRIVVMEIAMGPPPDPPSDADASIDWLDPDDLPSTLPPKPGGCCGGA